MGGTRRGFCFWKEGRIKAGAKDGSKERGAEMKKR